MVISFAKTTANKTIDEFQGAYVLAFIEIDG